MKNLKRIFEKNGINLSKKQISQFESFFTHMIETNKVLNLTAITDEDEVIVKHFLDSVLPIDNLPKGAKVVDVGSGAGFPAIPIKIVRDDLDIFMVDSLNKRVNFLNEVIKLLKLTDATAVHARAEEFAQSHRENFDVAVARAVAPLNTLVEYLLPLVKIGGVAVIYKASKLEEELGSSQKAIQVLGAKVERVDSFLIEEAGFEKIERKILILRKIAATQKKYPRPANKPKLSPIA